MAPTTRNFDKYNTEIHEGKFLLHITKNSYHFQRYMYVGVFSTKQRLLQEIYSWDNGGVMRYIGLSKKDREKIKKFRK